MTATWSSADLDSAASEDGVVHESTTNTDHDSTSRLKPGYKAGSPYNSADLSVYYPMHEDSGSTIYDMGPQTIDATPSGATLGVTAPLDTTGWGFDGTDDYAESDSNIDPLGSGTSGEVTVAAWVKFHSGFDTSQVQYVWGFGANDNNYLHLLGQNGDWRSFLQESGSNDILVGSTISSGTWSFLVVVVTPSDHTLYLDASSVVTSTHGLTPSNINASTALMAARSDTYGYYADVDLWDMRIYNRALSTSEIQALYDVVDTQGTMVSGGKTI